MSADTRLSPFEPAGIGRWLETAAAWTLAILWALPLVYAVWTAFHPAEFSTRFDLTAPLTLQNFANAWNAAPFARYFANTVALVTLILVSQFVLCTLAAYAFARYRFFGADIAFFLVLMQLLIMPDILIVENYRTMARLGVLDSIRPSPCPTSPRPSASSCCARPSRPFRASWTRPPASRAPAACASCSGSMCRWPSPSTSPMAWSRSATTGTTSCGR